MDDGDEFERTLDELERTLDELRHEVADERRSGGDRRSGGGPALLRFTEQYTIPAVMAILEANIRTLELLAGSIRLADGRTGEAEERTADRTLDALDGALTDVREAVAGTPTSPEARRLLREARELRTDAERRIEERTTTASGGAASDDDAVREIPVDVEAELESIKREVDDADHGGRGSEGNDAGDEGDRTPGR